MSLPDLERLRPVWVALSDLYLDTELQPHHYDWISSVILESGCTADEVEHILRQDVSPALSSNLVSVAGVWAGFDEDWLVKTILKRRSCRTGVVRGWFSLSIIPDEWDVVRRLVEEKRAGRPGV